MTTTARSREDALALVKSIVPPELVEATVGMLRASVEMSGQELAPAPSQDPARCGGGTRFRF